MKPRYLIPGLIAILVAAAVPTFGLAAGSAHAHRDVTARSASHRSTHGVTTAKLAVRAHRAAANRGGVANAEVAPLDAADVAKLAATGSLDVPVRVSAAATVSVVGESAIGTETTTASGTAPDGSTQRVDVPKNYARVFVPTSAVATRAETVVVPVELTAVGRAAMSRGEKVELVLVVDSAGTGPRLITFVPMAG